MSATLFSLTFAVAAPFWALMILLPGWSWTARIIASPLIVLPVLVLTILLGPLGLAAYLAVRTRWRRPAAATAGPHPLG